MAEMGRDFWIVSLSHVAHEGVRFSCTVALSFGSERKAGVSRVYVY